MEKIFLIDGHAQIFRMYYAFMRRPMINSKGTDTSILFGFTKMLLELIAKEHPTHIAVAFDPPAKTFRHEAYPEYKANRTAAPELVKEALVPLQEILAAFDIPVVMIPGYEADDAIGSMASQWKGDAKEIYMVTPDKDYGQLIDNNVFQYKPAKGGNDTEIIGKEEICNHYGICTPEQVIDILTIWGDSSDNVPGVRGIGEVGAKKLIGKYGSIEQIIAHSDELPPKQREAFLQSAEQLDMSRFLITIKRDINLPLSLQDVELKPFNYSKILEIFNKYEFNSLIKLLPASADELQRAAAAGSAGILATDKESSGRYTYKISECACISDFESNFTLGNKKLLGIKAIDGGGLILSAYHYKNEKSATGGDEFAVMVIEETSKLERHEWAILKDILENKSITKVGYVLKQLIKELSLKGIDFNGFTAAGYLQGAGDIEIMHYLINSEKSHKEEMLIKSYLGVDLSEPFDAQQDADILAVEGFDLFSTLQTEEKAAVSQTQKRACALMLPLYEKIIEELESLGQSDLYNNIEMPLIGVLADMELCGVKIDVEHLKEYSIELTAQMEAIEQQVRHLAGDEPVNLSSPKQVGVLLYEKLKLNPKVKKSSRGNYPTDEETLMELSGSHPIISKILEYRALKKLLSTYIDNLPALISKTTGRLHTTFNQAVTATGRLSSTNPNLQNIPVRTERGKEIRKAFIPSLKEGFIVSADYSQIELRLMAHMSGDKGLIEAFNNGKDIHTATAAKVFNVPENEVSKEQRSRAKTANFGIIYGISAFGLSQRLGMGRSESKQLIEEYFKNYPDIKAYMNNMIEKTRNLGYVETIYGRRRFLPDINSRNAVVRGFNERNAINAPLQGSAADIIKVAMINVYKRLKTDNFVSKMVLQVHDELVFDVVPGEEESLKKIVKEEMESVIKLKIPLTADCNGGKNWLEAH